MHHWCSDAAKCDGAEVAENGNNQGPQNFVDIKFYGKKKVHIFHL